MNKLICVLLIASMSWVSLPAKAQTADSLEALRAETKAGFDDKLEIMKPVPVNDLCNIPPAMIMKAWKRKL